VFSMGNNSILPVLLQRGNMVSLLNGKLTILPRSGLAVPEWWYKKNRLELLTDVTQ
jgi:hypothetical protein